MADTKISLLTAAGSVGGTERIPASDGTATAKYLTPAQIRDYLNSVLTDGLMPKTLWAAPSSDVTLSNVNTAQSLFGSAYDAVTLEGSTTYHMRGLFIINNGGTVTTHTKALGFALGGGASVTSWEYYIQAWMAAANTITTSQSTTHVSGVAAKVFNATGTTAYTTVQIEGFVRMNAGGTVTPQITFSAAPGVGTHLCKVGSFLRFDKMGGSGLTNAGPWA